MKDVMSVILISMSWKHMTNRKISNHTRTLQLTIKLLTSSCCILDYVCINDGIQIKSFRKLKRSRLFIFHRKTQHVKQPLITNLIRRKYIYIFLWWLYANAEKTPLSCIWFIYMNVSLEIKIVVYGNSTKTWPDK